MQTIFKTARLVPFVLVMFGLSFHVFSQNAIINPGFESGLAGWSFVNEDSGTSIMEVDNSTFFSGNNCGKVSLTGSGALGGFAQNMLLEQGATYEVSCMCKTDELTGIALPYLNINNDVMLLEYGILPIGGTTDWYKATARLVAPGVATNATFFLFVQGDGGTAYFDDVTFTKIENQGVASFTVNTEAPIGTIRPFMHVNAGPINPPFSQNLTSAFQDLQIQSVRTHDFYGPCDIHSIFPDFNADVNDPGSYQFEETDEVIAAIVASGAEVFFRLGESYSSESLYNAPPSDNQKMADICKNIVRHYNDGWNNGFNFDIEYWEIWNEPDLYHFWSGTASEFTTMYGVIANTLRDYDPELKIIGPAVSSMISEWFVDEFLGGVSLHDYPLDGFSYHMYYMANPYGFKLMEDRVEQKLAQYGLQNVPHYLTEWNNYSYSANGSTEVWRNDPFSAASSAASLIYIQDTELQQAHRYRSNEFLFGLFDDNSNITYSGLAYQQFSLFNVYENRLATTGGDSLGFAILAGTNNLNDAIQLMVANNSSAHSSYVVDFGALAENESYAYTISRIDSTLQNELLMSGTLDQANAILEVPCAAPFVDKIQLQLQIVDDVQEKTQNTLFSIAPNPASEIVVIQSTASAGSKAHMLIIDSGGKITMQQVVMLQNQPFTINIENLAKGQYRVVMFCDGKMTTQGLIVE